LHCYGVVIFVVMGDRRSFSSIQKTDGGNYTCRATNRVGGVTKSSSASVLLDVVCK